MYTPPAFRIEDPDTLRAMMRANPFAILLIPGEPDMAATHLPLRLDDERDLLIGHVAGQNPAAEAIRAGHEAMAIFQGPHAYVSPTWYSDPTLNVPTWNYVVIHAFGRLVPLSGEAARRALSTQIADYEERWRITDIEEGRRSRLEAGIQCFEFEIHRLQGKAKLSQNKSEKERGRLADALRARGEDEVANLLDSVEPAKPAQD